MHPYEVSQTLRERAKDESIRLKRTMPMAGFWKFIGQLAPKKKQEKFKRFSGVALLGRAEPPGA